MPRPGPLALALALAPLALLRAHDSRALEPSPPPARFQLTIEEGSPWGDHRLYVRLFPPAHGLPHPLPFMAGTSSYARSDVPASAGFDGAPGMAAFEVTPPKHTPRLRPPGWAELGEIPPDGTYPLRVSAGDAGSRLFELTLTEGRATLKSKGGDGRLDVAIPTAARLPRNAFTFRVEQPEGCCSNSSIARKVWHGSLLALDSVRDGVRPAAPLTDTTFEHWLDEGWPLLIGEDPRAVLEVMREFATSSHAFVVVRWYGGLTWDLRDVKNAVWWEPDSLPNLDYTIPLHLRGEGPRPLGEGLRVGRRLGLP